jgi:V8-like Glu-specific endopeptidase
MGRSSLKIMLTAILLLGFQVKLQANDAAHKRLKSSTVWILSPAGSGSGVLIDAERQLVVTAAHVVDGQDKVAVFAPVHDENGKVWAKESYLDEVKRLSQLGYVTFGRVIAISSEKDLAVLWLDTKLTGLREIKVATAPPKEHDGLHICGNPADRPLFTYAYGGVRTVEPRKWTYRDGRSVDAEVIVFSGQVWFGNSGGPVANEDGDLVGVITGGGEAINYGIAAREITRLLETVTRNHVFSITNNTGVTVYYSTKWQGQSDWRSFSLEPGCSRTHWWNKATTATIRFRPTKPNGSVESREYEVDTYGMWLGRGAKPDLKKDAKEYGFSTKNDGTVNLYKNN